MSHQLRAIIADDEPLARQALRRFTAAAGDVQIVGEAEDLPSLREMLRTQPADVLFLDITMPGGSGLDAVVDVPPATAIVFTTAHAEHAATAYQIDAVDYLLKPFGQDRVTEALARVRRRHAGITSEPAWLQMLVLRLGTRLLPVSADAIWRLEGSDDFVRVVTAERAVLHGTTLAALSSRLDPARFLRVHRSHVVNLAHVSKVVPLDERRLAAEFPDGTQIPCSRAGSALLRQRARVR